MKETLTFLVIFFPFSPLSSPLFSVACLFFPFHPVNFPIKKFADSCARFFLFFLVSLPRVNLDEDYRAYAVSERSFR